MSRVLMLEEFLQDVRVGLRSLMRVPLLMIFSDGVVFYGIGAGILIAAAVTRFMSSLLFQISPLDVSTFAIVAVGLLAVGLATCFAPALRAIRIQPAALLRSE